MKTLTTEYLEEFDLEYEITNDHEDNITILATEVFLECGKIPIRIIIEHEPERLCLFTYCPLSIPRGKRVDIAEFITMVNFEIMSGAFKLDFNDGEIGFQSSFFYEQGRIEDKEKLSTIMYLSLFNLETYLPGVLSIVYGDQTASKAISRIQYGTDPKLN